MTNLESIIYEAIKADCKYDYCSDVKMLSEKTGMKKSTIKGVVGSLVKKGLVDCQHDDHNGIMMHDIFAIVNGEIWSYAVENGYATDDDNS